MGANREHTVAIPSCFWLCLHLRIDSGLGGLLHRLFMTGYKAWFDLWLNAFEQGDGSTEIAERMTSEKARMQDGYRRFLEVYLPWRYIHLRKWSNMLKIHTNVQQYSMCLMIIVIFWRALGCCGHIKKTWCCGLQDGWRERKQRGSSWKTTPIACKFTAVSDRHTQSNGN